MQQLQWEVQPPSDSKRKLLSSIGLFIGTGVVPL